MLIDTTHFANFVPKIEKATGIAMNYLTDTKNLVRNSYLDSNKYLFTDRANSSGGTDKTAFSKMLAQAQAQSSVNTSSNQTTSVVDANSPTVAIKSGDTLTNIVKGYFAGQGQNISSADSMHLAQLVAKSNGIQNPDKIFPGQQLNLRVLSSINSGGGDFAKANITNNIATANTNNLTGLTNNKPLQSNVAAQNGSLTNVASNVLTAQGARSSSRVLTNAPSGFDKGDNPVLNKTLDRAVEKGFIPAQERSAVYEKIVNMSKTYQFHPDDFARLTLMESDGMNPKATNNRCHGIIQFCEGPDRGAASAGFASNPKDITNHSVLQQLDLVSKYFDETGLKNFGPANLDDLYLTVLTPAARSETRTHANLNIAGSQASMLHVNRDTSAPITRHSIIEGLHQNAINRLGLDFSNTTVAQNSQTNSNAFAGVQTNNTLNARSQALIHAQNNLVMNNGEAQGGFGSMGGQGTQNVQLLQATLLAQAAQTSQTSQRAQNSGQSSNPVNTQNLGQNQTAQTEQVQFNPANSSTQRTQALRVSAYLNQTYLP